VSDTVPQAEARAAIAAVLTPYVGKTMAEASAQLHLDRLARPVGAPEVDELVNGIGRGLKVFVGEQRAALVQGELRTALSRLLGGP
jgi:hypothetical protein